MSSVLCLSKLSRGHVEISEHGSRLEIFADAGERALVNGAENQQFSHVPKTFSTRRGPLVLFAETGLLKKSKSHRYTEKKSTENSMTSSSLTSPPPLKLGELKRSILAYSGSPEEQFIGGVTDEDGTFIHMKFPSKKRLFPLKHMGDSPTNIIKKRYMISSMEDKRRDLESIMDSDYSSLPFRHHSTMKTHVLSDEISLIPPIYRNADLVKHSSPVLSDVYRFFKIENSVLLNDKESAEQLSADQQDPLQIIDAKGSRLSYESLDQSEKEKILADLLIQSALHSIAEQQNVEIFEDALNRVRDSEVNDSSTSFDRPTRTEENNFQLRISNSMNEHQQQMSEDLQYAESNSPPPNYMFGKMQGSKWARTRPLISNALPTISKQQQIEIDEQHSILLDSNEISGDMTNTNASSDLFHPKVLLASQMISPTNALSQQDLSLSHQHLLKLPVKWRKIHDSDSSTTTTLTNVQKSRTKTRRDDITTLCPIVSSPFNIPHDNRYQSPIDKGSSLEKPKVSSNLLSRSRDSKRNVSRIGTSKTFNTDRCVTSPLSTHEQAERLRAIDSAIDDIDEDRASSTTTPAESVEGASVDNASHSAATKTDVENDQHIHPSELNLNENPHVQQSVYIHRTHEPAKPRTSTILPPPPGALLIAPGGEILSVSRPPMHFTNDYNQYSTIFQPFPHQPATTSVEIQNDDQHSISVAPCVPIVLGTKRERLPDETVVRRTMNLTGGDFNSQIGIQVCGGYNMPAEQRQLASQPYTSIPTPPTMGLSPFTGRKHHYQKRSAQEWHNHAMLRSTLSMHSEASQHHHSTAYPVQKTRSTVESQIPLFGFTTWAYQRPPTPPTIKRPYLYKPDYRPEGVRGSKHPLGENETRIRRTINVHAGDIDASLSFTIWVYDMWINDLIESGADPHYIKEVKGLFNLFKQRKLSKADLHDKDFLAALAHHAQALAKIILKRSDSGHRLAEDAQLAIIENLRNLKHLLDTTLRSVSDDDYREILRDTLRHVLNKGNLQDLRIDDEILAALMDYPVEAFEIHTDPHTGQEYIRIKSAYRTQKNKIKANKMKKKTKTVITSEEISADDFEQIVDEQTGELVFRLKKDIAERKGLTDLASANFDIVIDKITGKRTVQMKKSNTTSEFKVEFVLDPETGNQILVMRKEVVKTPPLIQSDITVDDFEMVIDAETGQTVLRLRADVAVRKGLTNLMQTNFEIVVDPTTGQKTVRIKDDGSSGRVEIVTDAVTGKQTIRMVDNESEESSNEPTVTITENDIDLKDFERVIDPTTGREVLRMKADVLKAKGLEELVNAEFEIVIDAETGQSTIVLKTTSADLASESGTNFEVVIDAVTGKQKIIKRTVTEPEDDRMDVVETQLNANDFERVIDPETGREVMRLKKGAAARKGLIDLLDVQFEMVIDADGKQKIVVKGGGNQGNAGDVQFELITDASGRTTIKIKKERPPTPELEVTEKPIDMNDFDEIIDPKTGLKVLKLKVDVAKRAGMMDLLDAQFETYIDPKTGKQAIRIKQDDSNGPDDVKFEIVTDTSGKQVLRMVQEIPKTVEVTNSDVNANDFEEVIDTKTGKKVLRMKKEIARRKGFVDMDEVDFEYVIDEQTGVQTIQIQSRPGKISKGHVSFEMIVDPTTGQQTLRMKQEVEVKFETVENDLIKDDFEEIIDQVTGERTLKLTASAAARKGLTDLQDVEFEIYVDPNTGEEQIRMKGGVQTGKTDGDQKFEIYVDKKTGRQKIVLKRPKGRTPPPMEKSIDVNDFEKVLDPNTGKEFYRFTDEAVRRKGLTNVKDMEFDIEIDETTGKTVMKPKMNSMNGQKVEVLIDPTTGEQTIRVVQEKPIEKTTTIMTNIDLGEKAFAVRIDPVTGKTTVGLSQEILDSYGLENVQFEQVIDQKTGETSYHMKPIVGKDGKTYELVTDPTSGKQTLQIKETVSQEELQTIIQTREAKGLRVPAQISGVLKLFDQRSEGTDVFSMGTSTRIKKKADVSMSPDEAESSSSDDINAIAGKPSQRVAGSKLRPMTFAGPSGEEYEIEWTLDDEKELNGLGAYEQRKRKEQILAEKRRKVAEIKRQAEVARLKKHGESVVISTELIESLLSPDEKEGERNLRHLDADRGVMSDDEYQTRRKKLFDDRARILKVAYDRKLERIHRQAALAVASHGGLSEIETAQLQDELQAQIQAEEELLMSMMNPEEREDYIRARNEERARQRLVAERERAQREKQLQDALVETKRMAALRAAEITAEEFRRRSANALYAEMQYLTREQRISRAFTYSYFSLLEFL